MRKIRDICYVSLIFVVFLISFMLPCTGVSAKTLDEIEMTIDEQFLLFGSSGGIDNDECDITLEEINNGLELIRQRENLDNIDVEVDDQSANTLLTSTSTMTTGVEGYNLIKTWEGCVLKAYKVSSNDEYYTIGYGHYGSDVTAGMTITQAQADSYLINDIKKFEGYINNYIAKNNLHLNQNQFDALISFTYNVGTQWMSKIDMPKMLINGYERFSTDIVYEYFGQWRRSGGVILQGLVNRRKAEATVFLKPCYDMCSVTSVSLNIGSQLGEVLYFSLTNTIAADKDAIIRVVHGTKSIDYKLQSVLTDSNNCRVQIDLPVNEASDVITAYIYDGYGRLIDIRNSNTSDGKGYHFSLDEYAYLVGLETDNNLKNLVAALKTYSLCANDYFTNKNTTGYLDSSITIDTFAGYKRQDSGQVDGCEFLGASLVLEGGVAMRYYFAVSNDHNIGEYSFSINDKNVKIYESGNVYYVEVINIAASDIDNMYTVRVSNSKSQLMTIKAGVLSYAYSIYNNNMDNLKALMDVMYKYNRAAKIYFG